MKKYIILAATSVISAAAGAFGGYVLAKRHLDAQYNERLEREIEDTKRFYSLMHKKGFKTPGDAVAALIPDEFVPAGETSTEDLEKIVQVLKYQPSADEILAKIPVKHNVFDGVEHDEDYAEEKAQRVPGRPYVIDYDDFMANETEFEQVTLTWFAGDGVLVDNADKPIERVRETVGVQNMDRFGHFSRDPRTVYIRNEKFGADFEVVRHDGKYTEDVLGLDVPTRAG